MPKVTKIVLFFDDGTTYDTDVTGVGSVFMSEAHAVKCGHNPPYGTPPHSSNGATRLMSASTTADAETGKCYLINGVVICP